MESQELESALERVRAFYGAYTSYVGARVVGYPELLERLFTAFLSGGHVLLEGAPGLGKPAWQRPGPPSSVWSSGGCSSPRTSCLLTS